MMKGAASYFGEWANTLLSNKASGLCGSKKKYSLLCKIEDKYLDLRFLNYKQYTEQSFLCCIIGSDIK